jgi:PAS domain S-box-containing protein
MKKLTGYAHREVPDIGAWMPKLYPDEKYRNYVIEVSRKSRQRKNDVISEEFVITRKNGEKRIIEFYVVDIIKDGTPTDFQIVQGIDITERKRAEKALRESEEKFRLAFENANTGMCLIDLDGNLQRVNTRMCEIFGYSKEELEHMNVQTISHPEDVYISSEFINGALSEKFDYAKYEKRYVSKQGQNIWGQVSVSLVRDSQGNPLYFVSQVEDITKSKRMAQEIKKLSKFPSEDPSPVLRVKNDGTVLYANQAGLPVLKTFGCGTGEVLPGKWKAFFEKIIHTGIRKEYEIECENRIFKLLFTPIEGTNFINIYGHDITELKRAETQLREDKRKLRSLALELTTSEDRERRRIAEYLHDMISQALVVIKMKLGTLQELKDTEPAAVLNREIRELLEKTIESTRSITFDLNSPVLDRLGFEPAAEWLCEKIAEDHGLSIDFRSDSSTKDMDDVRKRFLYRSTRELLMNVVKHAHARCVKVSVLREKSMVCITVVDDGDGFRDGLEDNRYMERGFGLFSIRERLDHLGGHMEIESKPGRGIRVSLYIPIERRRTKNRSNHEN